MATAIQPAVVRDSAAGASVAIDISDGVSPEVEADERPPDAASNSGPVLDHEQAIGSGGRIEASASLRANNCCTTTVSLNLAAQLIGSSAAALIYHNASGDRKEKILIELVGALCILLIILMANQLTVAVRHSGGNPGHGGDHNPELTVSVEVE